MEEVATGDDPSVNSEGDDGDDINGGENGVPTVLLLESVGSLTTWRCRVRIA